MEMQVPNKLYKVQILKNQTTMWKTIKNLNRSIPNSKEWNTNVKDH
jgi:hypothetical protein